MKRNGGKSMKSSKGDPKVKEGAKKRLTAQSRRTQTAEGWRRSVKKICEKRREKKEE